MAVIQDETVITKAIGGFKSGLIRKLRGELSDKALAKVEAALSGKTKVKRLTKDARARIEELAAQGPVIVISTDGKIKPWKVYSKDGFEAAVRSGKALAERNKKK